jgi:FlaA1/EpsC-like NDP-sugar epimerase
MIRSWPDLASARRWLIEHRRPFVVGLHMALVVLANHVAFLLRFDGSIPPAHMAVHLRMLPWLLIARGSVFVFFRLYEGLWKYSSIWDLCQIVFGVVVSSTLFVLVLWVPTGVINYPRSVILIDALVLICLLGGARLGRRIFREIRQVKRVGHLRRVLIFGAGDAGEMIVRDMKNNASYDYEPVGFLDDDETKVGRRIHGVAVLGTRKNLPWILNTHGVDEILIAIPSAEPRVIREIVQTLSPFKMHITTLPNLRDLIERSVGVRQIRRLRFDDLLVRAPVGLDTAPLRYLIEGRRVLVTGAGGSIGGELCRQLSALKPESLVLLDRYENGLYAVANDVGADGAENVHPVIGDITDENRLDAVFAEHRPHIVFHAAAHKHVPLMEGNPCEAVKNNVRGTRLVAQASERWGVDRFIMISTDKAVNPVNIMGATKRAAELLVQALTPVSDTSFFTVRFGNVLGSNGSVVLRFLEQIEAGGPVTVTHPEIERYFMSIREAVQLVLHAAATGQTGDTYILDMGEQLRLLDVARDLIRLSGFVPEREIPITFIGLRPGDKLSEELVCPDEESMPWTVEKIIRVSSTAQRSWKDVMNTVQALEKAALQGNTPAIYSGLVELIPECHPAPPSAVRANVDSVARAM